MPVNISTGFLCITLLMFLSACSTLDTYSYSTQEDHQENTDPSVSVLTSAEKALYKATHWQISGRVSILSEKGAWSGLLRWRQENQQFVLNLDAPLGQGALKIQGNDIGVELTTADGRSLQADDIDTLMEDDIGWELPVSGMRYWIFGIPREGQAAIISRHENFRIKEIKQSDWRVAIKKYQWVGQIQLPQKLTFMHDDLKIKMVIHNWNINQGLTVDKLSFSQWSLHQPYSTTAV